MSDFSENFSIMLSNKCLRPFLKFAYQLKIFLKFHYSAVLNKLIRYSS